MIDIIKLMWIFFIFLLIFTLVSAHTLDAELQKEIEEGRNLAERFQKGEIKCQDLTKDNFHSIGEYVMDLMVGGDDHLRMNQMMRQMHGEEGEELMHINMGKRFLGCDSTSRQYLDMKMPMVFNFLGDSGKIPSVSWQERNYFSSFLKIFAVFYVLMFLFFPIFIFVLFTLLIVYLIKKIKKVDG